MAGWYIDGAARPEHPGRDILRRPVRPPPLWRKNKQYPVLSAAAMAADVVSGSDFARKRLRYLVIAAFCRSTTEAFFAWMSHEHKVGWRPLLRPPQRPATSHGTTRHRAPTPFARACVGQSLIKDKRRLA